MKALSCAAVRLESLHRSLFRPEALSLQIVPRLKYKGPELIIWRFAQGALEQSGEHQGLVEG